MFWVPHLHIVTMLLSSRKARLAWVSMVKHSTLNLEAMFSSASIATLLLFAMNLRWSNRFLQGHNGTEWHEGPFLIIIIIIKV